MTLLFTMPGGTEWIFILIILGLFSIPGIFYLITLQLTFDSISNENRMMPSANVWLLLIPIFGLVWHFKVVSKLTESIKAEAITKGIYIEEPKPAYNIGLAMCILNCIFFAPYLNLFSSIAGLICWIIYWGKIASYKRILTAKV